MPTQVVAHAAKVRLEMLDEAVPAVARRADPMNENRGRAAAFDRVGRLNRCGHRQSGYLSIINAPAAPQSSFSASWRMIVTDSGLPPATRTKVSVSSRTRE